MTFVVPGDPDCLVLPMASAQLQGGRKRQEDAYLTQTERHAQQLVLVADGLGGHAWGDRASRLAVTTIERCFLDGPYLTSVPTQADIVGWLHAADDALWKLRPYAYFPATTIVGALFLPLERRALLFAVGDSLVLHHHDGEESFLFIPDGRDNTVHHALGWSLGYDDEGIAYRELSLEVGDRFVFATDGLLTLGAHERQQRLRLPTARGCVEMLMHDLIGMHRPRQDNVTVVAVDVRLERPLSPEEKKMLDVLSGCIA